jgi:myo-inositol-1(or 4)-monophosphatase
VSESSASGEDTPALEKLLAVAVEAAMLGARAVRRRPREAALKGGDPVNVVTDRDVASQRAIFRRIRRAFPDHHLVGEEEGQETPAPATGGRWTVDPLDGTSNFAHGHAPYGVSIGHARDGVPLVGVIAAPTRGALAWAVRGRGAFLRERGQVRRLSVSRVASLDRALILTGYGYDRAAYPGWLDRFGRILRAAQGLRMSGSAVNDLISVASGTAEAYWEDELQPWDWAAGALLVEEAGGRATARDGRPLGDRPTPFLASNGALHEELVRFLGD